MSDCHLESSNSLEAWGVKSTSHETSTQDMRHTSAQKTPTWMSMTCYHLALRVHH